MALLRPRGHGALLSGAWGFTTAIFYASFWSHVGNQARPAEGNVEQAPLTSIIGVMWVITIVGFLLSLLASRRHVDLRSQP